MIHGHVRSRFCSVFIACCGTATPRTVAHVATNTGGTAGLLYPEGPIAIPTTTTTTDFHNFN